MDKSYEEYQARLRQLHRSRATTCDLAIDQALRRNSARPARPVEEDDGGRRADGQTRPAHPISNTNSNTFTLFTLNILSPAASLTSLVAALHWTVVAAVAAALLLLLVWLGKKAFAPAIQSPVSPTIQSTVSASLYDPRQLADPTGQSTFDDIRDAAAGLVGLGAVFHHTDRLLDSARLQLTTAGNHADALTLLQAVSSPVQSHIMGARIDRLRRHTRLLSSDRFADQTHDALAAIGLGTSQPDACWRPAYTRPFTSCPATRTPCEVVATYLSSSQSDACSIPAHASDIILALHEARNKSTALLRLLQANARDLKMDYSTALRARCDYNDVYTRRARRYSWAARTRDTLLRRPAPASSCRVTLGEPSHPEYQRIEARFADLHNRSLTVQSVFSSVSEVKNEVVQHDLLPRILRYEKQAARVCKLIAQDAAEAEQGGCDPASRVRDGQWARDVVTRTWARVKALDWQDSA